MILIFKNKIEDHSAYLKQIEEKATSNVSLKLNHIYFGDNDILLSSMLKQRIYVDSIYIDPPFATNNVFKDKYGNEAYSDKMLADEFLLFLQEKLIVAHALLKQTGFFWIHIDQKMSHYVKVLCDEIFGINNFVADIITSRVKKNHTQSNNLNIANDNLLFYRKSKDAILNPIFKLSNKAPYWHAFDAKGQGEAKYFDGVLISPPAGTHWRWSQDKINEGFKNGILRLNKRGRPEYLVEPSQQKIDSNWCDIAGYTFRTGYPTEKNVEILKRVLLSSTKKGDLVLDFFAGSGTTVQASMDLNRNFIVCDKGQQSIETMKKRFDDKIPVIKFELNK